MCCKQISDTYLLLCEGILLRLCLTLGGDMPIVRLLLFIVASMLIELTPLLFLEFKTIKLVHNNLKTLIYHFNDKYLKQLNMKGVWKKKIKVLKGLNIEINKSELYLPISHRQYFVFYFDPN